MKLRLKKFRKLGQSALLCPWEDRDPKTKELKSHGMMNFSKIGDEQEIPDHIGYQILSTHSDMLEAVTAPASVKKKA